MLPVQSAGLGTGVPIGVGSVPTGDEWRRTGGMVLLSVVAGVGKSPGAVRVKGERTSVIRGFLPLGLVIGVYHMVRIYHP